MILLLIILKYSKYNLFFSLLYNVMRIKDVQSKPIENGYSVCNWFWSNYSAWFENKLSLKEYITKKLVRSRIEYSFRGILRYFLKYFYFKCGQGYPDKCITICNRFTLVALEVRKIVTSFLFCINYYIITLIVFNFYPNFISMLQLYWCVNVFNFFRIIHDTQFQHYLRSVWD